MNQPGDKNGGLLAEQLCVAVAKVSKASAKIEHEDGPLHIALGDLYALTGAVARQLRSASSSCADTVPAGWKLVPLEPTRDMKKAGALALIGSATHPATSDYRVDLVYGAMVKNAPVPESADTVPVPVKHLHSLVTDEPLQPHLVRAWAQEMLNAAGQVPNVEARPNYGGSAGQSRDEQSSATRLKAETPATAAPLSASAEHDPWKEAVIDGLIVNHIYSKADEEEPRKALNKLLAWEQSVALDPKVSSAAEALVEQGRQSVLSSTAPSDERHQLAIETFIDTVAGPAFDREDLRREAIAIKRGAFPYTRSATEASKP